MKIPILYLYSVLMGIIPSSLNIGAEGDKRGEFVRIRQQRFCNFSKKSSWVWEAFPHISVQYVRYGCINEWYNWINVGRFNTFLSLCRMPMFLEIFFSDVLNVI